MGHQCSDPLFHEALDQAEKLAAIRQVLNGNDLVTVNRFHLMAALQCPPERLVVFRRSGAYRELCEAVGVDPVTGRAEP